MHSQLLFKAYRTVTVLHIPQHNTPVKKKKEKKVSLVGVLSPVNHYRHYNRAEGEFKE